MIHETKQNKIFHHFDHQSDGSPNKSINLTNLVVETMHVIAFMCTYTRVSESNGELKAKKKLQRPEIVDTV